MRKVLKQMKWDVILTSLLYVVLGITILVMPYIMFKTLGYLIGAFLIVGGAVSMIGYLLRDAHQNYYRNDFVYGLVEITIGIIVLYKIENIRDLIPVILGILVVTSGCRKLQDVIDMKRMEYGNWIAMLVLAAANVIFGVVLILDPTEAQIVLERLIGAGLIISGATDCVIACYFAGKIKKYLDQLEAVDSTCVEITKAEEKAVKKQKSDKKDALLPEAVQTNTLQPEADRAEDVREEAVQPQEPLAEALREEAEEMQDRADADVKDSAEDEGAEREAKGEGKGEEQ